MTLDQLLKLASDTVHEYRDTPDCPEAKLARGILDLLGEDLPCGYETPTTKAAMVEIPAQLAGLAYPDEARALAASLLRAADEAEKGTSNG